MLRLQKSLGEAVAELQTIYDDLLKIQGESFDLEDPENDECLDLLYFRCMT